MATSSTTNSTTTSLLASSPLLQKFELYGWEPRADLSFDDNLMDLVLLVTRQSHCKQGSMACILVSGETTISTTTSTTTTETSMDMQQAMVDRIIGVSTNGPIFSSNDSDVHAEIAAIGQVAQSKEASTHHATAYITMPPCKRCFAALAVAGIKRIVTRLPCVSVLQEAAGRHGIELVALGNVQAQTARVNEVVERAKQQQQQQQRLQKETCDDTANGKEDTAESNHCKRAKLE